MVLIVNQWAGVVRPLAVFIVVEMGFALWMDPELAWAQGTHEYRPMGVAVVARSDLFRQRDFKPERKAPPERSETFVGLFASLGDVNDYLEKTRARPLPVTIAENFLERP